AGHLIVALTVLWMQPKVLSGRLAHVEASSNVRRIVSEAVVDAPPQDGREHEDPSLSGVVGSVANVQANSATDSNDEHTAEPSIGAHVAWSGPEVLADDVAWDDDVEVVD
ncbi:MAG: hypothetical protein ACO3L7_02675, partial [Poseidonia sp.]